MIASFVFISVYVLTLLALLFVYMLSRLCNNSDKFVCVYPLPPREPHHCMSARCLAVSVCRGQNPASLATALNSFPLRGYMKGKTTNGKQPFYFSGFFKSASISRRTYSDMLIIRRMAIFSKCDLVASLIRILIICVFRSSGFLIYFPSKGV